MEVTLDHGTVIQVDLAMEGSGKGKHHAALELGPHSVGIHHGAAINNAGNFVHPDVAIDYRDFGDLSHVSEERGMRCKPQVVSFGYIHCRHQFPGSLHNTAHPGLVPEVLQTHLDRINTG